MKILGQLFCCAICGALSFWVGSNSTPQAGGSADLAKAVPSRTPALPDASALAEQTQAKLGSLPNSLWGPSVPETLPQDTSMAEAQPASIVPANTPQPAPAPLPEPDRFPPAQIAERMSGSISAIIRSNGEARLVIADRTTTVRKVFRTGDLFEGSWRITNIQSDHVMLARKGETVRVPVAYSAHLQHSSVPVTRAQASRATGPALPPLAPPPRRRVTRRIAASI